MRTVLACLFILVGSQGQTHTTEVQRFEQSVVAALAGATEIAPGVRLSDRHSVANRTATRNYLMTTLKNFGLHPKLQTYAPEGANVYAEIPSTTGSKRYVVVGAHFDSIDGGPGANDDATGVAMILALAHEIPLLKTRNLSVILVLFDQEEDGLIGSKNFARWMKQSGVDIHSVHTVDQMGWDNNRNRAIELEKPTPELLNLYQQVAQRQGFHFPLWVTDESGSDHSAFRALGFPAIGLTEEYHHHDTTPYYHTPQDRYETVNFDYLFSSTKFFAAVIFTLLKN